MKQFSKSNKTKIEFKGKLVNAKIVSIFSYFKLLK